MMINDLQILRIRQNGKSCNLLKCSSVNFWLLASVL